jgi:hypothetical protein
MSKTTTWYPASELPEAGKEVMVYHPSVKGKDKISIGFFALKKWWARGHECTVTHWAELPEPPQH